MVTGIYRIFDMTVGQTGLSPEYMGGKPIIIKAVADKKDGTLLGLK